MVGESGNVDRWGYKVKNDKRTFLLHFSLTDFAGILLMQCFIHTILYHTTCFRILTNIEICDKISDTVMASLGRLDIHVCYERELA